MAADSKPHEFKARNDENGRAGPRFLSTNSGNGKFNYAMLIIGG